MITIPILYSAQLPSLEASADAVTGQSGTLQIRFTFSEDWDAYPRRTAMFISKAAARPVLLNEEGCAIVPASVIPHGVSILRISVFGNAEDESGNTVRYNGAPLTLRLRGGGQVLPDDCREITAYEQLLARVSDLDSSLAASMDWISSSAQLADACSRDAQNAQKAAALSEENAAESLRLLTDLKEEISEILQLESALQITEIRNAAAEQKEEIAAADAVLYTAQNRNETEKAAARGNISAAAIIPLTASGVSFTAENTASAPVLGLRLFGNSTENITETVTVSISGQAYPIPVPGGLRGIRTASGGNYIDADGQDWICDELDFARGVYIQRIDSSENSIIPQPEETPLREDQLAVFRTMKTDSPAAAAANDSGLFMELTYAADTKLYVDRKDAEIEHSLKETLDALKESGELNVGGIDVTGAKVGQTVKIAEWMQRENQQSGCPFTSLSETETAAPSKLIPHLL